MKRQPSMKGRVCVDLDGVLAKYDRWRGPLRIGRPVPGAKRFLQDLQVMGLYVIIASARDSLTPVRIWLMKNKMPYNELWEGRGKPVACAYVDDRAVRCTYRIPTYGFEYALNWVRSLKESER